MMKVTEKYEIVYGLKDPRDGQIRYIGQTIYGWIRPYRHWKTKRHLNDSRKVSAWCRELLALGLEPAVVVLEELHKSDPSKSREAFHISQFDQSLLLNETKGGVGTRGLSDRAESIRRAKISADRKGKVNWKQVESNLKSDKRRKIFCADTGEIFRNTQQAARALGINRGNLSSHLRGRTKTCGGYRFEYFERSNA